MPYNHNSYAQRNQLSKDQLIRIQRAYDRRISIDEKNINRIMNDVNKMARNLVELENKIPHTADFKTLHEKLSLPELQAFSFSNATGLIYNAWRSAGDYDVDVPRETELDHNIKQASAQLKAMEHYLSEQIVVMNRIASSHKNELSNLKVDVSNHHQGGWSKIFIAIIGHTTLRNQDMQMKWRKQSIEEMADATKKIAAQMNSINDSFIKTFDAAIQNGNVKLCKEMLAVAKHASPYLTASQFQLAKDEAMKEFLIQNYALSKSLKAYLWMDAATTSNTNMMQNLLDKGIQKPKLLDAEDRYLIKSAWKNKDVLKLLLETTDLAHKQSAFLYSRAVCDKNIEILEMLKELKIPQPAFDKSQLNLFHLAAKVNDIKMMKYLMENQFSGVNDISSHDRSFWGAIKVGFSNYFVYFFKAASNTIFGTKFYTDDYGKTALHFAAETSKEMYEFLKDDSTISKNMLDEHGYSAEDIFQNNVKKL